LRHRIRALARQLEVRMLVIDEIHLLLVGTFREQRIILNADPHNPRFNGSATAGKVTGTHRFKKARSGSYVEDLQVMKGN
jgi:hypothetical protein